MLEVLICCAPADRELAEKIGARLERGAELDVVFDDSGGESVAAKWEAGLSSGAILLLLSPESVPPRADRTEWGALLDHVASNGEPPVASLLARECAYPRILERRNFFRWADGGREALRAIERWAIELHRDAGHAGFTPARLPWFEDREEELEALWEALVDEAGIAVVINEEPASGKTALAQEFCLRAGAHFRQTLWVDCGQRSRAAIVGELAEQIGVDCPGEEDDGLGDLLEAAGRRRVLVVLDDCPPDLVQAASARGRASVLLTTRSAEVPAGRRVVRPPAVAELPIAPPENEIDARLLKAMAVCRRGGFPLELAARVAGLAPAEVSGARSRLIERRLADPFDEAGGRLRVNALAAGMASGGLEEQRRRHAGLIHQAFAGWMRNQEFDRSYTGELMPALEWAAGADWPLACSLARHGFAFLRHRGRIAEGAELLDALRDAAEAIGDQAVSDECAWELSWLRGEAYRGLGRAPVGGDQLRFDFG